MEVFFLVLLLPVRKQAKGISDVQSDPLILTIEVPVYFYFDVHEAYWSYFYKFDALLTSWPQNQSGSSLNVF